MYNFRLATEDDVVRAVFALEDLIRHTNLGYFNQHAGKIHETVSKLVETNLEESFVLLAEDENQQIVGFIMATTSELTFSYELFAVELGFWVKEELKNKAYIFTKLFFAYEKWAKSKGCYAIHFSSLSDDRGRGNRFGSFLTKQGYKPIEQTYFKEIT